MKVGKGGSKYMYVLKISTKFTFIYDNNLGRCCRMLCVSS